MREKKQNQKTNKSTEKKTAVAEMLLDEELLKAVSGGEQKYTAGVVVAELTGHESSHRVKK